MNLDKREFICPHGLGGGLKLWEQINNPPGIGEALVILLACSNGRGGGDFFTPDDDNWTPENPEVVGRWAGDRIAVVGDYAVAEDLAMQPGDPPADFIYLLCCSLDDYQEMVSDKGFSRRDELAQHRPFVDITHLVRPIIEAQCRVRYVHAEYCKNKLDDLSCCWVGTNRLA